MFAKLMCGAAGVLMLAATATATGALASEAMTVAERAGFLIGHAQRCGVAQDRLERSAKRLDTVIAAFSSDSEDRDAAQAQFAASIATAALAEVLGDKLPSCAVVRSTLVQFERHRDPAKQPEGQTARGNRRDSGTDRQAANAGATPKKAARRTSARRDDRSREQHAELALRGAAPEGRGKPPAI